MGINNEPTEGETKNEFKIPGNLTEAVAGIGNSEIRNRFLEIVAEKGLGDEALAITPGYIQGIEAEIEEMMERVIDVELKQALQLKERVLPQIALAVMLHEAGEDDEADAVLNDVYAMLSQEVDILDEKYREYFQTLLGLV